MYIENELRRKLRKKFREDFNQLMRCYKYFKTLEPEIEFYLYEDFNEDNPNRLYYRLDILNSTKCVASKANVNFKRIVDYITRWYYLTVERNYTVTQ